MVGLLLAPVVLSLLVLGAHFTRSGNFIMVIVVLVFLALLGVRRRWVARLVQVGLVLGAIEWVRTLVQLVAWRSEAGAPVLRLTVILACVALLTAVSALAFRAPHLRRWYDARPAEVTSSVD